MHCIRLRHPWNSETREGMVYWSRSFNWPAGTADREVVSLAVQPWPERAQVEFNDQLLEADGTAQQCVVSALLQEYNRLRISLPLADCPDGSFPLEVQLQIEE